MTTTTDTAVTTQVYRVWIKATPEQIWPWPVARSTSIPTRASKAASVSKSETGT